MLVGFVEGFVVANRKAVLCDLGGSARKVLIIVPGIWLLDVLYRINWHIKPGCNS